MLSFFRCESEVPKIIENFVLMMQKLTKRQVGIFRYDLRKEFVNDSVETFLRSQGIKIERFLLYTQSQNAVVENAVKILKIKFWQRILQGKAAPLAAGLRTIVFH